MHSIILLFVIPLLFACQSFFPDSKSTAHLTQGNEYARDGLFREAVGEYKKSISLHAKNYTAFRNLGMVQVILRDYKNAMKNLTKSLEAYQNNYETHYYLGEAYRGLDNYAKAIYHYQNALEIHPKDVRSLKSLSWSYVKIRYYTEALEIAKHLYQITPTDHHAIIILSRIYLKLKQINEALALINDGKKVVPKELQHFLLSIEGDIYYEQHQWKKAELCYQQALSGQPLLAGSLLGLGKTLMQLGKENSAATYLEQAIKVRPQLTEGLYLLGTIYEKKDKATAIKYFKQFYKNASNDPEFLDLLPVVRNKIASLD